MVRVPVVSLVIESWKLASTAFHDFPKKYRKKQQIRSVFAALMYPRSQTSGSEFSNRLNSNWWLPTVLNYISNLLGSICRLGGKQIERLK